MKASIVVAGAGIAGLAAALALRKAGHDVVVVERSPALRTVGAGILVQANGLLVLDALGLGAVVRAGGAARSAFVVRDRRGRVLLRTDFGAVLPSPLHPVAIHRAELHRILWQACAAAGVTLHLGCEVTGVETDTRPLALLCRTGAGEKRIAGDLIVGADGVRSVVRDSVGFATHLDPVIEGSVQGVAALSLPESVHGEYFARGEACGMLPIGGTRTFWFWGGSGKAVEAMRGWTYRDWRARVCERFPAMQPVLDQQEDWPGVVHLLHRSVRCAHWSRGNVVLIGDAAHAMSPNLGQGANCALVDALALACHVAATPATGDLGDVLRRFERERRPPVETLQRRGHQEGIVGTQGWPGAEWLFGLALRLASLAPRATRHAAIRTISGLQGTGFDLAAAGIGLPLPWQELAAISASSPGAVHHQPRPKAGPTSPG